MHNLRKNKANLNFYLKRGREPVGKSNSVSSMQSSPIVSVTIDKLIQLFMRYALVFSRFATFFPQNRVFNCKDISYIKLMLDVKSQICEIEGPIPFNLHAYWATEVSA